MTGLLGMTAGLAIVLSHNRWRGGPLPIMVTLFGWASLIKGSLLLLLSPAAESMPSVKSLPEDFREVFFGGLDYAILGKKL